MSQTIDIAITQLGVKEATGNNDGIPAELYSRGDEVMWCASFLLWCNAQSKDHRLATTDKEFYQYRSVLALGEAMKARGWWLPPGSLAQRNDIVLYNWAMSDVGKPGRHTDIVDRVEGKTLHTVGGNQDNAVTRATRKADSKTITGFVRIPSL